MKKLMTLLSAAAVAFGLQAADTGTSFEGMAAGDLDITSTIGELSGGPGYWETNGNEQVSLKVIARKSREHWAWDLVKNYPRQYDGTDQLKYLEIKTPFGNPAKRNVKTDGNGQQIGEGFYFDSLVKFTAFDEDPTTTAVTNDFNGAKIAVWVQEVVGENEVVTGTNIYVRAGSSGGAAHTYDCGPLVEDPNVDPNGWHRLTVKAIASIYKEGNAVPGFAVYIDNAPVVVNTSHEAYAATTGIVRENLFAKYDGLFSIRSLFPSMDQEQTGGYLSSVSFDGQGEVDDIVFTATAPDFAKDAEFVSINWTPEDIATLTIGETVLTSGQIAEGSYPVTFEDNLQVAVSVTYVEGKVRGTWTTTEGASVSGDTFTFTAKETAGTIVAVPAAASFNGTSFADLADAITAANEAESSLPAPVLKLFKTTSEDEIAIENENSALVEIDLNGQTNGNITALSPLSIVDTVGGGVVAGAVYFDAYGSITAGTYNASVTFGSTGSITGGRFIASANTADALNPFAPQGKEFVEGTGADTGYLVLGNATVKYTIKFISGEGSATNEYEIAAGGEVVPPVPAVVVGKEFSAWDPAVVTPAAADATYTALYTNKIYTITFVNEIGADPASTNYTIASGMITLPTATTENTGVQFDGWTNATITAAIKQFTPTVENVGDFTLYAAWSSAGSTNFDGGDGSTFTIDPGAVATVETATGHQMTDTVAGSDMTYAQAYALGLIDENTGDVAELDATIELKDGKVVVGLSSTPTTGYAITLKVYEKASLTDAWPVEPTETYTLDSAEAAAGFTPGSAAAGFYKAEVTIGNK